MPADHAHHDHDDHGHDHHGHGHGHHHHDHEPIAAGRPWRRYAVAVALVAICLAAACTATVRAGQAVVITRFGSPVRIVTEPGLAFRLPAPIERATVVDRRLATSSSGLHAVLCRDGISLVAQAYVAWHPAGDEAAVLRFVRSVGADPAAAEDQLRTLLGSTLETVTGRYALADLLAEGGGRLAAYEADLAAAVAGRAAEQYGIAVVQVGIERLGLPESTAAATVQRMAAERDTVAAERRAAGERQAGEIEAAADRDARLVKAKAAEEAAAIAAKGQAEAAAIARTAYAADPHLYEYLRDLDTLGQAITAGTRLVLRTDAAPFRPLVEGPERVGAAAPAPLPTAAPATAPAAP